LIRAASDPKGKGAGAARDYFSGAGDRLDGFVRNLIGFGQLSDLHRITAGRCSRAGLSRENVVIADGAGRSIEAAGKPEGIRGALKREQLVAEGAIIGEFGL